MNARQRRRAHYLRNLSAPATREAAVAQAVDQHLADLGDNVHLQRDDATGEWIRLERVGDQWAEACRYPDLDAFVRAEALDIPAVAGGRSTTR
jgi:hypothetical protein